MNNNKLKTVLLPVILALAIVLGMFINSVMSRRQLPMAAGTGTILPMQGSKLDLILNMINYSYVDTVDVVEIEEKTIPLMLKDLDPHTVYIPAKDMTRVNEELVGNFGGIGVQFYKYLDTVTVVKVVPGGPSERAGLQDGDRIVRVNDSLVAGVNMNTDDIMKLMRGEVGTDVELTIVRRGEDKEIRSRVTRGNIPIKSVAVSIVRRGADKEIRSRVTRGNIPIKSVAVSYMADDTTGFVKVNTFGMNTYNEFMAALEKLSAQGMRKLIVDLRDNEGGVLDIAVRMINEFLPEGRLILYHEGKASPRVDFKSNGKGQYQQLPLVVLINEFSASASEIFAGAIQDNDRGTIVGRRSFGKGLVQDQRILPDGSALRLTIARYYIPSGRCIQKPYDQGIEKYYSDIYERFLHGEALQKDSIHFDENLKFQTIGGRTVYGGGGIMPDVFVPNDTTGFSDYLVKVSRNSQVLYEYTFEFMDRHRPEMRGIKDYKQLLDYLKPFDLVDEMADYAARHGVPRDPKGIRASRKVMDTMIRAFIGRHTLDDDGFYPIYFLDDTTVLEALKD